MNEEIYDQILAEIRFIDRTTMDKKESHRKRLLLIQKYQDDYSKEFSKAVAYYNEHIGCFFNTIDLFCCTVSGCCNCEVTKGIDCFNRFLNTPSKN